MATLSVQQAARQVGIDRATIYRHIREGRISAEVAPDGNRRIDASELLRVYGDALKAPGATAGAGGGATAGATAARGKGAHKSGESGATAETAALLAQVEALRAALHVADVRLSEANAREERDAAERDRLLSIVEQQSRLLAAPGRRRGFFDFFTG